jgi:seryl-tRNA synthetase
MTSNINGFENVGNHLQNALNSLKRELRYEIRDTRESIERKLDQQKKELSDQIETLTNKFGQQNKELSDQIETLTNKLEDVMNFVKEENQKYIAQQREASEAQRADLETRCDANSYNSMARMKNRNARELYDIVIPLRGPDNRTLSRYPTSVREFYDLNGQECNVMLRLLGLPTVGLVGECRIRLLKDSGAQLL